MSLRTTWATQLIQDKPELHSKTMSQRETERGENRRGRDREGKFPKDKMTQMQGKEKVFPAEELIKAYKWHF